MQDVTLKRSYKLVAKPLPLELTKEERTNSGRICPIYGYFVTAFSCFQCSSFEIHTLQERKKLKQVGNCKYPKKASTGSRKITSWSPFEEEGEGKGHKATTGGMLDKVKYATELIRKKKSRQETLAALRLKYEDMSAGYASAVYQIAKKQTLLQG